MATLCGRPLGRWPPSACLIGESTRRSSAMFLRLPRGGVGRGGAVLTHGACTCLGRPPHAARAPGFRALIR